MAPLNAAFTRLRRLPLTTWVGVFALLVGVLGTTGSQLWGGPTKNIIVVAARNLAAFQQVSMDDVRLEKRRLAPLSPRLTRSLDRVRGHYLLRPVHEGQVFPAEVVGPAAPGGADLSVVALHVDDETATGVRRGETVDLALAPTGEETGAVVLPKVLLVDIRVSAGGSVSFLAIPRDRTDDVASLVGRAKVLLVRTG